MKKKRFLSNLLSKKKYRKNFNYYFDSLLFHYDSRNLGSQKCLVLIENLRLILEETLDVALQDHR